MADVQGQQHLVWTKTSPKSFVTGPFTMLSKKEEMLKETGNVLFIPSESSRDYEYEKNHEIIATLIRTKFSVTWNQSEFKLNVCG